MYQQGVVRGKEALAIHKILIPREGRDQFDHVTRREAGDALAHCIDDAGSLVPQACRELYGFDVSVIAPHRLGAVDADRLDVDTNLTRAGGRNPRFDELEDLRSPGLCELAVA